MPLRVTLSAESVRRRGQSGWVVAWRIRNGGVKPFTVVEGWHPHGRFRSSRVRRSLRVGPRASASLELPARVDAAPGETVENCFLILRIARGRERWRVLARSTVRVDAAGTPLPTVEAVDAHPAER